MTFPSHHRALLRRYLTWAYKSTKESFDRLERKTTQLMADEYILKSFQKKTPPRDGRTEYEVKLREFEDYVAKKRAQPVSEGDRRYLSDRLKAVEAAIRHFLGGRELAKIRSEYEAEFTRRIWEAKDH